MSIRDEIDARVAEGRIIEYEPYAPLSINRPVFLTAPVHALIVGSLDPNGDEAVEMAEIAADLDNFVGAGMISAAFGKGPKANFRRLEATKKRKPKVWEMRTTKPSPGYRLFGFFAKQDVFVGVDLIPRDLVDFPNDVKRANATWASLFGTHKPVVSENIYDYISEKVVRLRKSRQ